MRLFRTIVLSILLTGVLLPTAPAFAAEPSVVGVVNYTTVISESIAGKQADAELAALVKEKQAALEAKKQVLDQMRSDYKQQEATLNTEQKKAKEAEYSHLFREYQQASADANAEVNKKRAELRAKVVGEINEVVRKLGKEEKYTLIVDTAVVPFFQNSADLTSRVIAKYNESKN